LRLRIKGRIFDDFKDGDSEGFISEEGIVLLPSSNWIPLFVDRLVNFDLIVKLEDPNWEVISQGERLDIRQELETIKPQNRTFQKGLRTSTESKDFHWQSRSQEEIYLVAGPFYKNSLNADGFEAFTYLRNPEPELAEKYLRATIEYLRLYSEKIGSYPYKSFALIENYWETGYGMPSFTLLGPSVIRLPFLIYSSYPHEILHNWWGNGVYVDYSSGNWSEGLTTYMADHYFQEMRKQDVSYRRTTLQNYKAYVNSNNDFALKDFKGRHNASSQAVGYGKTMMFFHMLKVKFGPDIFHKAVQSFYNKFLFKKASFLNWIEVFEMEAQVSLKNFYNQWVQTVGAPEIELNKFAVKIVNKNHKVLSLEIEQIQKGTVYELLIPVRFFDKDGGMVYETHLEMNRSLQNFNVSIKESFASFVIDPNFDVFRLLNSEELPASFSEAFGSTKSSYIILPKKSSEVELEYYKKWAKSLSQNLNGKVLIFEEQDLKSLPQDGNVWIIGRENNWVQNLNKFDVFFDFKLESDFLTLKEKTFDLKSTTTALVVRENNRNLFFLNAASVNELNRVATRLPRYGSSSVMIFLGDKVLLNHTWPVKNSPLRGLLK
jgi:hypothetical protein